MSYVPNVLVVDDDINILAAFKDFLRREHCYMLSATSAEEAFKKLQEHRVDLLVTDVRLKLQSGVTFLLHVKGNLPKIPVIVITGYPDLISEQDARAYGADYFFLKPLEIDKLRGAVRKCLNLKNKE
jgi:two-component system response regulator HydG